jgi:hypothetical protein
MLFSAFLEKRELRDIVNDTLIDNGESQANPRLKNATCIIFKIMPDSDNVSGAQQIQNNGQAYTDIVM